MWGLPPGEGLHRRFSGLTATSVGWPWTVRGRFRLFLRMFLLVPLTLAAAPCALDATALSTAMERWRTTAPQEEDVERAVSCVSFALDRGTAQQIHRWMAQVTEGAHRRAAAAAADGKAGHSSRNLKVPHGWVQVDGVYSATLEEGRAAVLQRVEDDGRVLQSRYWWPGEDLGEFSTVTASNVRMRMDVGTGWGTVMTGLSGVRTHLGVGLTVGPKVGALFSGSYEGLYGRSTVGSEEWEPQPGFVHAVRLLAAFHFQAGSWGVALGPDWNLSLGRWDAEGPGGLATREGPAYGPGGAFLLDYGLTRRMGLSLKVDAWTDGTVWYPGGQLGLVFWP